MTILSCSPSCIHLFFRTTAAEHLSKQLDFLAVLRSVVGPRNADPYQFVIGTLPLWLQTAAIGTGLANIESHVLSSQGWVPTVCRFGLVCSYLGRRCCLFGHLREEVALVRHVVRHWSEMCVVTSVELVWFLDVTFAAVVERRGPCRNERERG